MLRQGLSTTLRLRATSRVCFAAQRSFALGCSSRDVAAARIRVDDVAPWINGCRSTLAALVFHRKFVVHLDSGGRTTVYDGESLSIHSSRQTNVALDLVSMG